MSKRRRLIEACAPARVSIKSRNYGTRTFFSRAHDPALPSRRGRYARARAAFLAVGEGRLLSRRLLSGYRNGWYPRSEITDNVRARAGFRYRQE